MIKDNLAFLNQETHQNGNTLHYMISSATSNIAVSPALSFTDRNMAGKSQCNFEKGFRAEKYWNEKQLITFFNLRQSSVYIGKFRDSIRFLHFRYICKSNTERSIHFQS